MQQLNKQEYNRYSRQIQLAEIGIVGQTKLKNAKVLVIGAGGLGCPVLQYLTAVGVGTLGIVDADTIDESNLQRQILYTTHDIGQPKALIASQRLQLLNPHTKFIPFIERLQPANAKEIIEDFDIIVDGCDNFATRYLVNDVCVLLNKPLVFGSILKFEGQVAVFNYKGSGTYRCLFPNPPADEDAPDCGTIGVVGVLPGIIGCLQANEVIKMICGIGTILANQLFILDALTFSQYSLAFKHSGIDHSKEEKHYPNNCKNTPMKEISMAEFKAKIAVNPNLKFIDVREENEYADFNIGGINIPLSSLSKNLDKLPEQEEIIVHCKAGSRSRKAIAYLQQIEPDITFYNLTTGLKGW